MIYYVLENFRRGTEPVSVGGDSDNHHPFRYSVNNRAIGLNVEGLVGTASAGASRTELAVAAPEDWAAERRR